MRSLRIRKIRRSRSAKAAVPKKAAAKPKVKVTKPKAEKSVVKKEEE
jgi:hypothetical protein